PPRSPPDEGAPHVSTTVAALTSATLKLLGAPKRLEPAVAYVVTRCETAEKHDADGALKQLARSASDTPASVTGPPAAQAAARVEEGLAGATLQDAANPARQTVAMNPAKVKQRVMGPHLLH